MNNPQENTRALEALLARWQYALDTRRGRPQTTVETYGAAALRQELAAIAAAQVGDRNNQLNRSAFALGQLVGSNALSRPEVEASLQAAGLACGLEAAEVKATVRSGLSGGELEPRDLSGLNGPHTNGTAQASPLPAAAPEPEPEPWEEPIPLEDGIGPEPFPLDVLPPGLRRFVEEAAWALNCPPDFVAVPLFVAAGACIGNSTRLLITRTHTQGAVLFAGVVGLTSSGKSPALELVLDPIEQAQERFMDAWRAAKASAEADRAAGIAAEVPPPRQMLADEATTEALAKLMQANPRGGLLALDEIAALVSGLNQYKAGGQGNDRQFILKLWPQATIRIHRAKNEDGLPLVVRRPFLGITGGIQPSVVSAMSAERERGKVAVDDGFLDRWLWAYPGRLPAVGETWREVSEEAQGAWDQAVRWLLDLQPEREEEGKYRPRHVGLSASGKLAWKAFTDAHAAETNGQDFPDHLHGAWGKLRGYCGRLALILDQLWRACGQGSERDSVNGESVGRAIKLVGGYFKAHARRVYQSMGADPRVVEARKVLRWIHSQALASVNRRDLWRGLRYQFSRPEDLAAPLSLLCQTHHLRVVKGPRQTTGRPASAIYEINPLSNRTGDTKDTT